MIKKTISTKIGILIIVAFFGATLLIIYDNLQKFNTQMQEIKETRWLNYSESELIKDKDNFNVI